MQSPLSQEVLLSELETSIKILSKWEGLVAAGLPGVDVPGSETALDEFFRGLCGEMLIVSAKCESIANILAGEL